MYNINTKRFISQYSNIIRNYTLVNKFFKVLAIRCSGKRTKVSSKVVNRNFVDGLKYDYDSYKYVVDTAAKHRFTAVSSSI